MRRCIFRPNAAKDMEWIGADTADSMVGTAHNKLYAAGNGTEFTDDKVYPQIPAN